MTARVATLPAERHAAGVRGWQLFRTGFLRSAGLPFEWLESLADPALDDLTISVIAAEERLHQLRPETVEALRAMLTEASDDERRLLLRAAKRVKRYRRIPDEVPAGVPEATRAPWHATLDELAAAITRVETALRESAKRESRALLEHVGKDYFTDAVQLSSPTAWREMARATRAERFRRGTEELLAYRFLQRFCGKNETGGHIGPLNLFTVGDDSAAGDPRDETVHEDPVLGPVRYTARGDGRAARRRTIMSYWAATAVGNALLADVSDAGAYRWLRRNLAVAAGDLDDLDARVLAAVGTAGDRTALAAAVDLPPDVVDGCLARLVAGGLVIDDWHIPDFTTDAGEELRALVRRLDTDRSARAGALLDRISAFAATASADRPALLDEIAERFAELTHRDPWRGGGVLMADRAVFYEEAQDNIEGARITAAGAARLGVRLSTTMDFLASLAIEARIAGQAVLARALCERGTDALPATDVRALPQAGAEAGQRFADRFAALVDPTKPVVELGRADLSRAGLIRDDLDDWPLFGAADLMLTGGDPGGAPQVILSELHHIWPTLACQLRALYDDERVPNDELWEIVARELAPAVPTLQEIRRDEKGTDSSPYGHHLLCLDTESPVPGAVPVAADRLRVRRWRNGFIGLHDPTTGTDLWLLPEYDDTGVAVGGLLNCALPALELPGVTTGTHTPRIVVDGVVLQRRRWAVAAATVPVISRRDPTTEEWRAIARWRRALDLPRRLYFLLDTEEKPIYLDFASVVSVRNFGRCVSRSERVVLTESLPAADRLWLTTPDGHLTSETRFQLWRNRGRT